MNPARKQSLDISVSALKEENQQHTLQLPDRLASYSRKSMNKTHYRRRSTSVAPFVLDTVLPDRQSIAFTRELPEDSPASSSPQSKVSMRRMSIDSLLPDVKETPSLEEYELENRKKEEDVFIHYYSLEQSLESMTFTDAHNIVTKFEDSPWSSKLNKNLHEEKLLTYYVRSIKRPDR